MLPNARNSFESSFALTVSLMEFWQRLNSVTQGFRHKAKVSLKYPGMEVFGSFPALIVEIHHSTRVRGQLISCTYYRGNWSNCRYSVVILESLENVENLLIYIMHQVVVFLLLFLLQWKMCQKGAGARRLNPGGGRYSQHGLTGVQFLECLTEWLPNGSVCQHTTHGTNWGYPKPPCI